MNVLAACVVPAGTVTGPQVSDTSQDRAGAAPTRALDSIVQSRPAFVGNGSFSVTPWASPLPEFQTVIVKPI